MGSLKLNFDGSSRGNPDPCGFGGVIRDFLGRIIHIVARPIAHGNSTEAEVMGLLMGLREIKKIAA